MVTDSASQKLCLWRLQCHWQALGNVLTQVLVAGVDRLCEASGEQGGATLAKMECSL